jgi:hypothetical protein
MSPAQALRHTLRAVVAPACDRALLRPATGALQRYIQGTTAAQAGALRVAFPTVASLLGQAPFDGLANSFARATPAGDWDLNAYGAGLPDWIAAQQADQDGAALADVARVDWAMHRAAFADDMPPLDRQALALAAAEQAASLRLLAHPATTLLRSPHPVVSLWRAAHDTTLQVPTGQAQAALVGRQGPASGEERVWMRPVQAGEAAFVAAVLAGQRLGAAADAGMAADAGFDFAAVIARHLAEQVWGGFTL